MFLKSLQIVNYKNLKSVKFKFNKGANTLIGENDAGKSNAMVALRILLDDTFYYNYKRLKETDFSNMLSDWRGHWIIISACFDEISPEERNNEICRDIISSNHENQSFFNCSTKCESYNYGNVTLFIRPKKYIRKNLYEANGNKKKFEEIRKNIKLTDYEFFYTGRSKTNFVDSEKYKEIVGDIDNFQYADPEQENNEILGNKIDILELWKYISVEFIDALRDVESQMKKPKNSLRLIIDTIQSNINDSDISNIRQKISDLNSTISNIKQISDIGHKVNSKLNEIVGLVYSGDIKLESQIKDDISKLSKFITMIPFDNKELGLLGLGHLNILFVALKLVEFEVNKNYELLNIVIIEEPEAHIHTHIQKTLFNNLKILKDYTQVIMTTHSTYLSEIADITRVNVIKHSKDGSIVMYPTNNLDIFGKENLDLKLPLTKCLERYLDAKRSVLLFSKGVILVEGDGEEILIPNLVKKTMGISLDELGIGIVNIGSVAFEYIACIFSKDRIQRNCAIITDGDNQVLGSENFKLKSEKDAKKRKEKLEKIFADNQYVDIFYSKNTFEIDFANESKNKKYIESIIDNIYISSNIKKKHKENLKSDKINIFYDTVSTVFNYVKKGWYAVFLSEYIDEFAIIPQYILQAIAFASKDIISNSIKKKIIQFALNKYDEYKCIDNFDIENLFNDFQKKFHNDTVVIFLKLVEKYEKSI